MADQFGGFGGPQQIIGGNYYTMYSPEWYKAMDANKVQKATTAGTATKAYAEAAMPDSLKGLLGSVSGALSGSGGGLPGSGTAANGAGYGGVSSNSGLGSSAAGQGLARVGGLQLPDMSAATDAAFASAKDKSGQIARSSIDSMRGELGATGNLGGGAEVQGVRDVINNAAGVEGQAARDISMKQADIGADFAKTRYGGEIAQRGQDVSAQEAAANLAATQEMNQSRLAFQQQQLQSQNQLQLLQLALSGLKSSY
jgi:hypothetical protein